jgi:hypothetical protein
MLAPGDRSEWRICGIKIGRRKKKFSENRCPIASSGPQTPQGLTRKNLLHMTWPVMIIFIVNKFII